MCIETENSGVPGKRPQDATPDLISGKDLDVTGLFVCETVLVRVCIWLRIHATGSKVESHRIEQSFLSLPTPTVDIVPRERFRMIRRPMSALFACYD